MLIACSFQTAEEAIREVGQAFCAKLKECAAEGYAKKYGTDDKKCSDTFVNALPEDDRDRRSACNEEEIDTCEKDIRAMTCEALAAFATSDATTAALPPSCQKC
ncbi:MAG: hypothetical protein KIT84_14625 [Labilithrix sp.]|nr:hypothetical protein [Labilithrix sp.]MCW5812256.1 hypothetical protein [Labilithrix sp.]